MTNESPTAPPAERHPRSHITRLPYLVVVVAFLIAAAIWGALTVRERTSGDRETVGFGDNAADVQQAVTRPPR